MGPREGPVSAPAWPFVRTLIDRHKFGVLIAAGTFLRRYLVLIRIEQNDACQKKQNETTHG